MKRLLKYLGYIFTYGASLVTYISGYDEFSEFLKSNQVAEWVIDIVNILSVPIILLLSYFTAELLTLYERKKMGTHQIPCSFIRMFWYRVFNKNQKILYVIHKHLYHHFCKLKERINRGELSDYYAKKQAIADFLGFVHTAIYETFNLDLAITIKKLEIDSENKGVLTGYTYHPNNHDHNSHSGRNFSYQYYIITEKSTDLFLHTRRASEYKNNYGINPYHTNSIFSYLMNNVHQSYWMSNDLQEDEKKGLFYTSSDNYIKHYKSMAVFKIAPPENNISPKGFIIFDSYGTNKFSEMECKHLMGFIAHLIYEIL